MCSRMHRRPVAGHCGAPPVPSLDPADPADASVLLPTFAAVIVKGDSCEADGFGGSPDADLDWSDFFFNLVSMVIVYVYFSKTTAAGESMVAIMLCMGVAGLDILLMALRWLWFDHYVAYGWVLVLVHTPAAA